MNALIYNGEQIAVLQLPNDSSSLHYELAKMGIRKHLSDIPIVDEEDSSIRVKLFDDSDIGNSLICLFTPRETLDDANICIYKVKNAPSEIQADIEQNILNGQYVSLRALMTDIAERTEALVALTVDYYCPLKFQIYDDEYDSVVEISNRAVQCYKDNISELVLSEQDEDIHDMSHYFDRSESAKAKIVSAIWDVETVDGELYGAIHTKLREPFTPAEEKAWIDELVGQAADGFGEGLEQREIKTDDGDLYVSFWNSGKGYYMENENDFEQRFESQKMNGMEMN